MKLAASLFCVAALSMVGCADVETTGGGQGEGIKPAKFLSLDPEDVPEPFNPQLAGMQQVGGAEGADYFCETCEIVYFKVPSDTGGINEVREVRQDGEPVCRIYMADGVVIIDECGSPQQP